jgi:hypothetical protein
MLMYGKLPVFSAIDVQGRNLFNRREVQSTQAFCAYTLLMLMSISNCKYVVLSSSCGTELWLGRNYCIFGTLRCRALCTNWVVVWVMLWTLFLTCFKLISPLKYSLYFAEVTTLVAAHVVHAVSIHYVAFLRVFPFMRLAMTKWF